MSSVNSIGSLISSLLTSNGQTSSSDISDLLSSIADSSSSSSDKVKLSEASLNKLKLMIATNGQSSDQLNSSISNLLSGSQSSDTTVSSMYNILISAQNAKLMQSNPNLVNMITTVEGEDSASAKDLNLLTMSPTDLLSIIKQYKSMASTNTGTASSQVDETV